MEFDQILKEIFAFVNMEIKKKLLNLDLLESAECFNPTVHFICSQNYDMVFNFVVFVDILGQKLHSNAATTGN